jgi:hypothetical protein
MRAFSESVFGVAGGLRSDGLVLLSRRCFAGQIKQRPIIRPGQRLSQHVPGTSSHRFLSPRSSSARTIARRKSCGKYSLAEPAWTGHLRLMPTGELERKPTQRAPTRYRRPLVLQLSPRKENSLCDVTFGRSRQPSDSIQAIGVVQAPDQKVSRTAKSRDRSTGRAHSFSNSPSVIRAVTSRRRPSASLRCAF